jgi:hypothetical protein
MVTDAERSEVELSLLDAEDRVLQQLHWKRFTKDLAALQAIYEIPQLTLENMIVPLFELTNLLGRHNWNGIGLTSGEEPGSVECVVDCFNTIKRLELVFDQNGVNIRQVSRAGVRDLGFRKRPYALQSLVQWLISG